MQKWSATAPAGRSVAAKKAQAVLGDYAHLFADFSTIRYCPECLAIAFHSHIFQVAAIARCPAHGHVLATTCQHCGASLNGTSLRPAFFSTPIGCDFCGRMFCEDPSALITADEQLGTVEVFSELDREFRKTCPTRVRCKGLLEQETSLPRVSQIYCQSVFSAAHGRCPRPSLFGEEVVSRSRDGSTPVSTSWGQLTFGQQLRSSVRTLKSIDRALAKRAKHVCGHLRPVVVDFAIVTGSFSELQHCVLMQPTDCPCSVALAWWRAETSKILALERHVAKLERQGLKVADLDGHYTREFSLAPHAFPLAVVSTFTRMALAIADIIKLRSRSASAAIHRVPVASVPDAQALARVIELPICRYGFEPSTIEIELDGHTSEFSCSLGSAFTALQFATTSENGSRRPKQRITIDKWYAHLGAYSLGAKRKAEWLLVSRPRGGSGCEQVRDPAPFPEPNAPRFRPVKGSS